MASSKEQLLKATQQTRADLVAALAPKDIIYNDLNDYLLRYRSSCDALILTNFDYAFAHEVENKLWDAHVKVNKRYQRILSPTRANGEKKTPVEHPSSSVNGNPGLTEDARHAILLSCHQTILRLGDLSRWREAESTGKESNWGPAIGYYDLAGAVYPPSGVSHNQLAVVARNRRQELSAIYHLYRSLAAEEPHPMAKGNLDLEFKKIETAQQKDKASPIHDDRSRNRFGRVLEKSFLQLHALCHKGVEFAEHDELENEVLSQIAIALKERSLDGLLNKIVLINITAQFHASEEFQNSDSTSLDEKMQTFLYLLRLNVRTFFTLLQLLHSELESGVTEILDSSTCPALIDGSIAISAVARRVLPALRQYRSWLTVNLKLLVNKVGDDALELEVKEMWKIYASTLTILARGFNVLSLPDLEYLLEEDEETICFKPFKDDASKASSRYQSAGETALKPTFHSQGVQRHHPNLEMAGRVRDFLAVGMDLAVQQEHVPIDFLNGDFVYHEKGMPSGLLACPEIYQATPTATNVQREDIPCMNGNVVAEKSSTPDDQLSYAPSSMVNMVNSIVQDEPVDHLKGKDVTMADWLPNESPLTGAGNETSYGTIGSVTAADLVKGFGSLTPQTSPRPRLPSIYNSPFALTADEEGSMSPGTTKQNTRGHLAQDHQQGLNGASANGYSQQSHEFSQQQQTHEYHYTESSLSSSGESNRFGQSQRLPFKGQLTTHSRRNYDINYEDSQFMSSNIFSGSSWVGGSKQARIMPTPPNGQGNGYGG